eukprot:GFUD01061209.1.p1 GENE.GFUD01061209.1~~GFUD01061209.1.p1  ORF type:complete len:371 (+),score=113.45 GFUD01061209.1:138-1250(+)
MENQNSPSLGLAESDQKLQQRKWVKKLNSKDKLARSLSFDGSRQSLKSIEFLSKLRSSNEAILDQHKVTRSKMKKKRLTLPIILQEISDSEDSLEMKKSSKENDNDCSTSLVEEETSAGTPRRWTRSSRIQQPQPLPCNYNSVHKYDKDQEKMCRLQAPAVCKHTTGKSDKIELNETRISKATKNRSFVALKRSTDSKEHNFENISNCSTLHNLTLNIDNIDNLDDDETIMFGNSEQNCRDSVIRPLPSPKPSSLQEHTIPPLKGLLDGGQHVEEVDDIKLSLIRLASILQDDEKDHEELRIASDDMNNLSRVHAANLVEDDDSQPMVDYRDILEENNYRKRKIVLLEQQLVEKDQRMRMLERLLRETHL